MSTIPDVHDPSVSWEPADEAALAEAGIAPGKWRTEGGGILGHDLPGGPPATARSVASVAEMTELEGEPEDDDEDMATETWEYPPA